MPVKYTKTNALRRLDALNIAYTVFTYDTADGDIDGKSVCVKIGVDANCFYKTLVTVGKSGRYYVFLIPVFGELDLKKASRVSSEKNIQMIAVKELLPLTGYERGGCSPIGMKKSFDVFIDSSVSNIPNLIVSAGKIGLVVQLQLVDFLRACEAKSHDLTI